MSTEIGEVIRYIESELPTFAISEFVESEEAAEIKLRQRLRLPDSRSTTFQQRFSRAKKPPSSIDGA
ncbi:Uu.00g005170.m01.CDS01 [Anthostomella pinea]|uniref:Uu.00g005170.m01.CDS01 n=1 Tax=Anthostomella pinea TaxID=933095 RepID=A0AAI8VKS8_9PEZI|nr:Uu.00g005170.m01.CDS01 [Anthostomella pinea]